MDNNLRNFGKGLKRARKKAGYKTQQNLADALNEAGISVTKDTVENWEQGVSSPTLNVFLLLCDFFHCSSDYLLDRIDEKNHDLKFICDYTGLSEESIEKLHSVYFDKQSKDLISHLIMEYGETYHDIYSYTSNAIDSQALANNNVALSGNAWLTNHLASRGVKTKNAPNIDGYEIISAKEALDFKLSEAARVFREFIKAFVAKKATEIKPIPSGEAESRNRADKSFMDRMDKMDKLKEIPKK